MIDSFSVQNSFRGAFKLISKKLVLLKLSRGEGRLKLF
jgi:hypothetical protein